MLKKKTWKKKNSDYIWLNLVLIWLSTSLPEDICISQECKSSEQLFSYCFFCVLSSGAAGYNVGGGQAGMYMNLNGGDNYQSSDNSVGDNVCAWDSTFLCAGVANSGFSLSLDSNMLWMGVRVEFVLSSFMEGEGMENLSFKKIHTEQALFFRFETKVATSGLLIVFILCITW